MRMGWKLEVRNILLQTSKGSSCNNLGLGCSDFPASDTAYLTILLDITNASGFMVIFFYVLMTAEWLFFKRGLRNISLWWYFYVFSPKVDRLCALPIMTSLLFFHLEKQWEKLCHMTEIQRKYLYLCVRGGR